jgi:hypothetical protein
MSDSDVRNFPTPARMLGKPHQFGPPVSVPASLELERHPQTERTCLACGAVKVTVHAPDGQAWREWRASSSAAQHRLVDDLPCVHQGEFCS